MRPNLRGTLEGYITRPASLFVLRASADSVATKLRQKGYDVVLAQEEGTGYWDVIVLGYEVDADVAEAV